MNKAIANAKKYNAAKKNELTQKGYKEATTVKNSVKTLLGINHKTKSGNADINAGYSVGSSKTAAKAALKKHAKTAVNNAKTNVKNTVNSTLKSASKLIEKGKKFLETTSAGNITANGKKESYLIIGGKRIY